MGLNYRKDCSGWARDYFPTINKMSFKNICRACLTVRTWVRQSLLVCLKGCSQSCEPKASVWNLEFLTELRACRFWSFVTCTLQNCPGRACTALERTKVWLRKNYWKEKKKDTLDLAAFAMSEVLRASWKREDGSSGSSVMWQENYYCQQGRGHQELEPFLRFSRAPWASSNSCRHARGSWGVPKAFGVAVKHRSHKCWVSAPAAVLQKQGQDA